MSRTVKPVTAACLCGREHEVALGPRSRLGVRTGRVLCPCGTTIMATRYYTAPDPPSARHRGPVETSVEWIAAA